MISLASLLHADFYVPDHIVVRTLPLTAEGPAMWNKTKKDVDRRDFMIASAAVGAFTMLADARAEGVENSSAARATDKPTVFTGDVIQGKKVVSALDVNDLEPGRKH
ncbi:MAG: hypothetical protein J0H36_03265, partial [Hyphomicrobium denitrificans]|nr:hypothetical protein [Hyphomicrobium denitrificans]